MMTFNLALRNIFRHKARSIVTLGTVVFGTVALIFVSAFFEDVYEKLRESFIRAQSGHIQIYRKGFNENGKADPYSFLIDDPDAIKALVRSLPEVKSVAARLNFSGLISTGENTISFMGQGLEANVERDITPVQAKDMFEYIKSPDAGLPIITEGRGLGPSDGSQITLGRGLAESMDAKPGASMTLLTETVGGAMNAVDVTVNGIFFTSAKDYDDIFLRLPLETTQSLLRTKSVERLVIQLRRTKDTRNVAALLNRIIAERKLDLELKTWDELADFYNKTAALLGMFQNVMIIVVSVVVIMGVFNTMNMAVMERISEIGTIMALGARRLSVMNLFFIEGLLLGAVGGAVGVLAGIVIVRLVNTVGIMMPPAPGGSIPWLSTPIVVPSSLVRSFALATVVGGLSSLYPAYKAARLQITTALRYR